MEYIQNLDYFRLAVIDGSELGPDLNGGREVCINGTGDRPLFTYTIDPTQCGVPVGAPIGADVPVIPSVPSVVIPSIPEPATWALMVGGIVASRLWSNARKRKR